MKEFIVENMEFIISLVSMLITWTIGKVTKRYTNLSNKLIPLQNTIIMVVCVLIYFFATGDISLVIASGSPVATLIYDVWHNTKKYSLEKTSTPEERELLEDREDE